MTTLSLATCFLAGIILGLLYFGSLWWTVQRLPLCHRPASVLLLSFLVRAALLLLGLYSVAAGRWERIVVCLFGLVAARLLLIRCVLPKRTTNQAV